MRFLAAATLAFLAILPTAPFAAEALALGDLQGEDCSYFNEQTQTDSLSYWRRSPPFVGYSKGERLLAGGDGTCVLGFPKSTDGRALVLVDGVKVSVYRITASQERSDMFRSRDGLVRVELRTTGTESTCEPDSEKCCGDYTYVTVTASKGERKVLVRAVTYAGG